MTEAFLVLRRLWQWTGNANTQTNPAGRDCPDPSLWFCHSFQVSPCCLLLLWGKIRKSPKLMKLCVFQERWVYHSVSGWCRPVRRDPDVLLAGDPRPFPDETVRRHRSGHASLTPRCAQWFEASNLFARKLLKVLSDSCWVKMVLKYNSVSVAICLGGKKLCKVNYKVQLCWICLSVLRDISERGRELEQVLAQYITFVKPAFEEFCLPVGDSAFHTHLSNTHRLKRSLCRLDEEVCWRDYSTRSR